MIYSPVVVLPSWGTLDTPAPMTSQSLRRWRLRFLPGFSWPHHRNAQSTKLTNLPMTINHSGCASAEANDQRRSHRMPCPPLPVEKAAVKGGSRPLLLAARVLLLRSRDERTGGPLAVFSGGQGRSAAVAEPRRIPDSVRAWRGDRSRSGRRDSAATAALGNVSAVPRRNAAAGPHRSPRVPPKEMPALA
jgi:hypothetical protein